MGIRDQTSGLLQLSMVCERSLLMTSIVLYDAEIGNTLIALVSQGQREVMWASSSVVPSLICSGQMLLGHGRGHILVLKHGIWFHEAEMLPHESGPISL